MDPRLPDDAPQRAARKAFARTFVIQAVVVSLTIVFTAFLYQAKHGSSVPQALWAAAEWWVILVVIGVGWMLVVGLTMAAVLGLLYLIVSLGEGLYKAYRWARYKENPFDAGE